MFNLYSTRIKNEKGELEVYEYEKFPTSFRNQLFKMISDVFNKYESQAHMWSSIHGMFAREKGLKKLGNYNNDDDESSRHNIEFYIDKSNDEDFLDFMDYVFCVIVTFCKTNVPIYYPYGMQLIIDKSVEELNFRLRQHSLGYEFVNGQIIRIDNKAIHETVIKPTLKLLYEEEFSGAEEEFRKAFEYRKNHDNKNAILEALKSFESTMKTICDKKNYPYNPTKDTAKQLIATLESNNFYPTYMNNHLANVRTTLETGLPVLRNKNAGHGQGSTVVNVSDEFTEYALNLAATNILLLVKIFRNSK
jgi:hypothetical protein